MNHLLSLPSSRSGERMSSIFPMVGQNSQSCLYQLSFEWSQSHEGIDWFFPVIDYKLTAIDIHYWPQNRADVYLSSSVEMLMKDEHHLTLLMQSIIQSPFSRNCLTSICACTFPCWVKFCWAVKPSYQTLYTEDASETRDMQEAKTLKKKIDVRIWVREGGSEWGFEKDCRRYCCGAW